MSDLTAERMIDAKLAIYVTLKIPSLSKLGYSIILMICMTSEMHIHICNETLCI